MPVSVDATLAVSRRRWLFPLLLLITSQTCLYLFSISLLIWPISWIVLIFLFVTWRKEQRFQRISINAGSVDLWSADQKTGFQWKGDGQQSFAFLRFKLLQPDLAQKLTFTLWRDSVSDASWRALNMAFRVNARGLKAEQASSSETAR